MLKKSLCLLLVISSFTANAAMTEKDCQNQAKAIYTLLEMVDEGTLPANDKYLAKLVEADKHYKNGEYCAARNIVLNLNQ